MSYTPGQPMSNDDLLSHVRGRVDAAASEASGAADVRRETSAYYQGAPFGNEQVGRSQVVTRDVLEVVEWAMPSIVRVFMSGDQVVSFDPLGPDDEEAAEQETDIVNALIQSHPDWYEVSCSWIKSALLYPNAYLKVWMQEDIEVAYEEYHDITDAGLVELIDSGNEPVEYASREELVEIHGVPVQLTLHSVRVRVRRNRGYKLCIASVPPEQVITESGADRVNLDSLDFVAHKSVRGREWLIAEGYDPDIIGQSGNYSDLNSSTEKQARSRFDGTGRTGRDASEWEVVEVFLRIDADGDGYPERRRVVYIGNTLVENDYCDYQPLVAIASILMPHTHAGFGLGELAKDLQLINSTLHRQMLDNIYRANRPRNLIGSRAFLDDGSTVDALLDNTAEYIPVGDVTQVTHEPSNSFVSDLLPVMARMSEVGQMRTGISPQLSLDPGVLQQSTGAAFIAAQDRANDRLELITRNFAEMGYKRLALKTHQLNRMYPSVSRTIKLRGGWVEVNPTEWRERNDLTVNVGLGHANREKQVALLMQVLEIQKEAAAAGSALSDEIKIYNTLDDLMAASGRKNATRYFNDPRNMPARPDPGPSDAEKVLQVEMEKMQKQHAREILRLQQEHTEAQQRHLEKMTEMELKYGINVPGAAV